MQANKTGNKTDAFIVRDGWLKDESFTKTTR
jgi:hypothetical protein